MERALGAPPAVIWEQKRSDEEAARMVVFEKEAEWARGDLFVGDD